MYCTTAVDAVMAVVMIKIVHTFLLFDVVAVHFARGGPSWKHECMSEVCMCSAAVIP